MYVASELRWDARACASAGHALPAGDRIRLTVDATAPATFTLRLRVPYWADGGSVSVNGAAYPRLLVAVELSLADP